MTIPSTSRVQPGVPAGGQFAGTARTEPAFTLGASTTDTDDVAGWETESVPVVASADFDGRLRTLLGVTDPAAKVGAVVNKGRTTHDETAESFEEIELTVDGSVWRTIEGVDSLPRLIRRLDHVHDEDPKVAAMRLLGHAGEPPTASRVIFHGDDGRAVEGRLRAMGGTSAFLEEAVAIDASGTRRKLAWSGGEVRFAHVTHVTLVES